MAESAWTEDMGQFFYHLDLDTRKVTSTLERIKFKIVNDVPSFFTKYAWIIYIYIYIKLTKRSNLFMLKNKNETNGFGPT